MRMTVKPYMKATREKMHKQKNTVFGNRIYLTNPMFYMDAKEILNVGQKSKNYQFVGGLYVPDKAHKYQPLEKE